MDFAKFLCLLLCILINIFVTTSQQCYSTGNYTTNSTYGSNRNFILSSLASNASANGGFTISTFGQDSDKVYALALCRGDTSSESCADCVNASAQDIMTNCPNQKEAYFWGGGTGGPFCLVRYANRSFFGILELVPAAGATNVNNITSNLTQFDMIWKSLMERNIKRASTGSCRAKFATEEANSTNFQQIYSLMQCTPDISQSDCEFCLSQSVAAYQTCCHGKQGGIIQRPNCIFRWDLYPFYNETVCPSLPPPPGSTQFSFLVPVYEENGGIAAGIVAIIVVSTVIFVAIVVFITYFFSKRRKMKKEIRSKQQRQNADEFDTVESLEFDFSTIRDATNNFSIDNKLGQGGFGPVYKGRLADGQAIAVKRLSENSGQGDLEFKNEVALVAKLQHRNLVRLLGFCLEGTERLLIYECAPNSSLDNYIFDPDRRSIVNWEMLEGFFIFTKILDCGSFIVTLRLFELDQTQGRTTRIVGTFGYMAPEYVMRNNSRSSQTFLALEC
ncbi:Cysteine-rich receptor-like protein kinase [Melia azedarach]|uniref:Cysteine-rich receptor-like protein kinase n=1 Tax=Melia azedarach TaxID=155640 RepID=A0ACC1WWX9_MELAZ|nr:Cysteine-rich receptor-like protein kinase [Melia azedarach]